MPYLGMPMCKKRQPAWTEVKGPAGMCVSWGMRSGMVVGFYSTLFMWFFFLLRSAPCSLSVRELCYIFLPRLRLRSFGHEFHENEGESEQFWKESKSDHIAK